MREFKFRAWDEAHKVFLYSYSYEAFWRAFPAWLNDGRVVHQFTGAKDKNGKEIYEGDIVNIEEHSLYHSRVDIHRTVIQYDSVCAAFVGMEDGHGHSLCGQEIALEVVGNIYENN